MTDYKALDTDPDPSPNAGATKLRRYWTKGPGAAKIGWGAPGDFYRCVAHLSKYVTDAKGLCNVYHRSAIGAPPGHGHGKSFDYNWEFEYKKAYSSEALEKMGPKGQAFRNHNGEWSYPIADAGDLANAIRAFGRSAEADRGKLRAYIERRARALGKSNLIPDKWHEKVIKFDLDLQETLLYASTLIQWSRTELIKLDETEEVEQKDNMPELDLEHKSVGVAGGGVLDATEDGIIEAIVSVTGIVDNVGDIIAPGAYEKTLKERTPKGVSHHDWAIPVSRPLEVTEWLPGDEHLPKTLANGDVWPKEAGALYVKAQFNLETQRGREAFSDAKFFGDQGEWSIGYKVPKGGATKDEKTGIRHIKNINLFEYSPVLFGAASNARTLITAAKSLFETEEDFLEEVKGVIHIEVADDEPKEIVPAEIAEQPPVTEQTQPVEVTEVVVEAEKSEARAEPVEVSLSAESMAQIKALHDQLGAVLEIITNTKQIPLEYAFDGDKGLSDAVSALNGFDDIKESVKSLEEAIEAENNVDIKSYANEALDEITVALQDEKTDEKTSEDLKMLVAAIGTSIKGIEDNVEEVVEEVPQVKTITLAEWENFLNS